MAHRPTFFLSSTIYDFRDLRSAIKFSLEERGCRVLASEFNDFGGNLDEHSYEACLTNIEQADYFVLLIGARVGGWYDPNARVSITQQEYRTAYALHQQRKLRMVTFVRSEVWQLKEDRKELARLLADMALTDSEKQAVAQAPSKFAKQYREAGSSLVDAAITAARVRLRPIVMTSLAFTLGVVPLMLAGGASAETQHAIGTGVFGGMITGTVLALIFVPTFFVVVVGLAERWRARREKAA